MPAEGRLAAGLRRRRERAALLRSGLVDTAWVQAQVGRRLDDDAAGVAAYDAEPGLSPHPLLEPDWLDPRRPWEAQGRSALTWYLDAPEHRGRSPHPLVSLAVVEEQVPGARRHPHGPLAAWLAHVGHDRDAVLPSRPGSPPVTLGRLHDLALEALTEPVAEVGDPADRSAPDRPGHPVGTSVVVALGTDAARSVNWIRSVAGAVATGADVELVAVGADLTRSHRVLARVLARVYDVRAPLLLAGPLPNADTLAHGVAAAHGARLVLVQPGVVPDAAAAVRLADVLSTRAVEVVQPLLVDRHDVVAAAGADADGPLLAGHATADADALAGPDGLVEVPAAIGPVVAVSAAGWPRPDAAGPARTVLAPHIRFTVPRGLDASEEPWTPPGPDAAQVTTRLLRGLGLDPAAGTATAQPVRRLVVEAAPRLRWTLDTAARAGSGGETWGDTHFARSLAQALRRHGQHVAVDPAPARNRWSRRLDDVVLVLRGLDRVTPSPGPLHLLWVISHPDLVEPAEVAAYDATFAASLSWSAARSREWGLRVDPLLQCTDPTLFHPGRAAPGSGADVLFVGSSRGVLRPALAGALAAGVPVEVHGGGWGPVLPDLRVASRHVANADLGALYAGAGVVLNDHWKDMRRDGFVSNRLFDATACAARVISDDIAGLAELFDGQVAAFTDPGEVAGLLADRPTASYADRLALAARVGAEHSFDRRAASLLDAAVSRLRRLSPRGA